VSTKIIKLKKLKFSHRITAVLVATLLTVVSFTSCDKDEDTPPAPGPQTYVLVHGAFQAAYSWNQVKTLLEAKGNRVITVDLPGHGDDMTDPATITMDSYRDKVVAAVRAQTGKVVLVGHSMGGMVISVTAEAIPEKISRLVYVGAFVPKNGGSLTTLAMNDGESQLSPLLVPTENGTLAIKDLSRISDVFCADATAAIKQELLSRYRPEPARAFTDVVTLGEQRFGTVSKSYIKTTNDAALGPKLQGQMIKDAGITDVHTIASSHCPHLSMPAALTEELISIAR
jgi:pimeloyl-ACP methyl ester carboxylesterase